MDSQAISFLVSFVVASLLTWLMFRPRKPRLVRFHRSDKHVWPPSVRTMSRDALWQERARIDARRREIEDEIAARNREFAGRTPDTLTGGSFEQEPSGQDASD